LGDQLTADTRGQDHGTGAACGVASVNGRISAIAA
jgi:hypothetical protein